MENRLKLSILRCRHPEWDDSLMDTLCAWHHKDKYRNDNISQVMWCLSSMEYNVVSDERSMMKDDMTGGGQISSLLERLCLLLLYGNDNTYVSLLSLHYHETMKERRNTEVLRSWRKEVLTMSKRNDRHTELPHSIEQDRTGRRALQWDLSSRQSCSSWRNNCSVVHLLSSSVVLRRRESKIRGESKRERENLHSTEREVERGMHLHSCNL